MKVILHAFSFWYEVLTFLVTFFLPLCWYVLRFFAYHTFTLLFRIEPHLVLKHISYRNTPKTPIFWLVTRVNTRDFTVFWFEFGLSYSTFKRHLRIKIFCPSFTIISIPTAKIEKRLIWSESIFIHSWFGHYFRSNPYGCAPRGPRGVKKSEFLFHK